MGGLTAGQMFDLARVSLSPDANADPDWMTAREWAKAAKHTVEYARRILKTGEESGVFAYEKRFARTGSGRVMLVDHWKFMGKAK